MLIILSQKIDSESAYSDVLFNTYHYPARYRNQIHNGDTFVYYQGNRYNKTQRYYFGFGIVGDISCTDGENYYAKLIDGKIFEHKIPIYLPDGGYIEQLDYHDVRNSVNPPWQSSVRPLSETAFKYIIDHAGLLSDYNSVAELKEQLKEAIHSFYVGGDNSALLQVVSVSERLVKVLKL